MTYEEIMQKLICAGYECYKVGGCVRNKLWNLPVTDIDLVTSATPEQIASVFNNSVVTCGNSFLVTLVDGIEVATYRTDRTDYAEVAHTLDEDLKRRDFTINALVETFDGIIPNFLEENIIDIEHKILRAVGNPIDRFIEDPVRIIRGLRFTAVYGLSIHYKTADAMYVCMPLVKHVPRERLRLELKKALATTGGHAFLMKLLEYGLFYEFFPSLESLIKDGGKYHGETVIEHALLVVENLDKIGCTNWLLKVAALYHDIGKATFEVDKEGYVHFPGHEQHDDDKLVQDLAWLKFSCEEIDYVQTLKRLHMHCLGESDKKISKKSVRKLVSRLKDKNVSLKDWFMLRYADKAGNLKHDDVKWANFRKKYRKILECLKDFHTFSIKDLAVDGHDVMRELGLTQGKEVGMVLKDMFEMVQNEQIENNRDALIGYLRRAQEINGQDGEVDELL